MNEALIQRFAVNGEPVSIGIHTYTNQTFRIGKRIETSPWKMHYRVAICNCRQMRPMVDVSFIDAPDEPCLELGWDPVLCKKGMYHLARY